MYWDKKTNTIYGHYENINNPIESYEKPVLESVQIKAIKMVIEDMVNNGELEKDKIHRQVWEAQDSQHAIDTPTVFIAKYTLRDDYGDFDCEEVFQKEEDAINYVMEKRDKEGAFNVSVLYRKVK